MKQLWILRHGKAAQAEPGQPDLRRPLTAGGKEQSRSVGQFLRARDAPLDRVVSSQSVRTRETAEAALEAGQYRTPLDLTERVYEASGGDLLTYLRELDDRDANVMLVGHMPGVGELLSALVTDKDDFGHVFKPGTLALVHLDIDHWSKLRKGKGELVILLPPPG